MHSEPEDPVDAPCPICASKEVTRDEILGAVESFEIIEAYPEDKYLPSYLVLAKGEMSAFHVLMAVDFDGDNVRIITAYRPGQENWMPDLMTRRKSP